MIANKINCNLKQPHYKDIMDNDLALPECDSKLAKKCVADIVGEWSNFCEVDIKIWFVLVLGIYS